MRGHGPRFEPSPHQWRSGAVTGRRGYPPRLRNGSPRRQAVTLWYPPRTIENESRFPGKAAGRGVTRGWCPFERLSRYPSSGAVSSLASAPQLDSIIHTCKPLTHSLNQHHVCTHKASHYGGARGGCGGADFGGRRASGSARQQRQLHGFGGIGSGGGGIGSCGRIGGGCGGNQRR